MIANSLLLNSKENNLEILVKPDAIIYSIMDENEQVILRQEINTLPGKSVDVAVYEHFFDQPELNILSENVTIVFANSLYQLVPSELFREANMKDLFEIEHGKIEGERLEYILIPKWGVHLIFSVSDKLMRFFKSKFPDAEVEHHIGNLLKKRLEKKSTSILANIRSDALDLLVIKENKLHLVSSFEAKTNEDICYFVLNAFDQLELDTESVELNIVSESPVKEELMEVIKSYINKVNL